MSAIQELNTVSFGTGRMYSKDQSGNILPYGSLQDLTMDVKTDIKEAYSEGNYAFATADGHKSIDLSAKHYIRNLASISNDLSGSSVATNTTGWAVDEAGVVVTGASPSYTLAHGNVIQIYDVIVGVTINGVIVPVEYTQVTAGSEVAGASYSLNSTTGKMTFASGEVVGETLKVTYSYTLGTAAGEVITVSNTYQNSAPTFQITAIKRDRSREDGSTSIEVWQFNAVRPAGIKSDWKEGDFNVLERTLKAFADPMGNVATIMKFNY